MTLSTKMMSRIKPFIFILLLLPSLIWIYKLSINTLGVNPIEKLIVEEYKSGDELNEFPF